MINKFNFQAFLRDCRGASAAEYALLLSIVAASLAMSAAVLGESISGTMNDTSDLFGQVRCNNNGQGTGLGGGNGSGGGRGAGSGSGNSC